MGYEPRSVYGWISSIWHNIGIQQTFFEWANDWLWGCGDEANWMRVRHSVGKMHVQARLHNTTQGGFRFPVPLSCLSVGASPHHWVSLLTSLQVFELAHSTAALLIFWICQFFPGVEGERPISYTVGCVAAALASTHQMPVAPLFQSWQPNMTTEITRCSLRTKTVFFWEPQE